MILMCIHIDELSNTNRVSRQAFIDFKGMPSIEIPLKRIRYKHGKKIVERGLANLVHLDGLGDTNHKLVIAIEAKFVAECEGAEYVAKTRPYTYILGKDREVKFDILGFYRDKAICAFE